MEGVRDADARRASDIWGADDEDGRGLGRAGDVAVNERFASALEAAGRLAQRQRREAFFASVAISGGVARAVVRAAKQAQAAELQRLQARRRKAEAAAAAAEAEVAATEAACVRLVRPADVLQLLLSRHHLHCNAEAQHELVPLPEGADAAASVPSPALLLVAGSKLVLESERRLVKWAKATAYSNQRAAAAAADGADDAAGVEEGGSERRVRAAAGSPVALAADSAAAEGVEGEEDDSLGADAASAAVSGRKRKREARKQLRLRAHRHGRGAGQGRGLAASGEPATEELHPSWRARRRVRRQEEKAVSEALRRAAAAPIVVREGEGDTAIVTAP